MVTFGLFHHETRFVCQLMKATVKGDFSAPASSAPSAFPAALPCWLWEQGCLGACSVAPPPAKWDMLSGALWLPFQRFSSSVCIGIEYIYSWHDHFNKRLSTMQLPFSPHCPLFSCPSLRISEFCRLFNFCERSTVPFEQRLLAFVCIQQSRCML